MLSEFDLLRPRTLPEALAALIDEGVMPIAGGTNIIADLRAGKHRPRMLVDVSRLAELRGIRRAGDHVFIGAGTTIAELLRDPIICQYAPALVQAASVFANPLIRNRATVGGNLIDASPAADTAPPLLALDAVVELTSNAQTRRVPLADFLVGVRRTLRRFDELLTAILWPVPAERSASAYGKLGLRKADAISVLSVAVSVACYGDGRCAAARVALGAVAPRPLRASAAESLLFGEKLTPATIAEASRLAGEAAHPISDIRGSAAYRRQVTEVMVRRLLMTVAEATA